MQVHLQKHSGKTRIWPLLKHTLSRGTLSAMNRASVELVRYVHSSCGGSTKVKISSLPFLEAVKISSLPVQIMLICIAKCLACVTKKNLPCLKLPWPVLCKHTFGAKINK